MTGHGRTDWKHFNKLDEILATRPATRPPILLETLDLQSVLSDHGDVDSDETDVEGYQQSNSQADISDNQSGSSSSTGSVSSAPPPRSSSSVKEDSDEIFVTDKVGIKGKKQKRSKGEILEDFMTKVVKTMSDGLKSSNRMFMKMEEKRLKFEEREHQLRIIQMLQGGMGASNMYPSQYHPSPPTAPSSLYYSPPGSTHEF